MELIKLLEYELNYHKKALKLSQKRLEVIKKEDLKTLKQIIQKEKEVIKEIKELEQKRINKMSDIGYERLKDYIEAIEDENIKKKISKIRMDFLDIINQLKENNVLSKKMLDNSNEILNGLVKHLTEEKEVGYNKKYQKSKVVNRNILNKKI